MIRKNRGEIEWLEFRLLQGKGVKHGVFLRKGIVDFENRVHIHQTHSKNVVVVSSEADQFVADGAITKIKEMPLAVKHADCQAAIFYDPVSEVIGVVHAGWRGMIQNIYKETIAKLSTQFHVRAENLLVCIGPSLEPEFSEFIHYKQEFPEEFWRFQVKPNYFNLWEIAKFQLKELGVLAQHIEIAGVGTYSHPEDFYSYRRDKTSERNVTIASLT